MTEAAKKVWYFALGYGLKVQRVPRSKLKTCSPNALAAFCADSRTIWIGPAVHAKDLAFALAHEVGHAFDFMRRGRLGSKSLDAQQARYRRCMRSKAEGHAPALADLVTARWMEARANAYAHGLLTRLGVKTGNAWRKFAMETTP